MPFVTYHPVGVGFYAGVILLFTPVALLMLLTKSRLFGWLLYIIAVIGLIIMRLSGQWLFGSAFLSWLSVLLLALVGLIYGRPSYKISFMASLAKECVRFAVQLPSMQAGGMLRTCVSIAGWRSRWRVPAGYSLDRFDIDGLTAELFRKNGGHQDRIILQFHGGSYIMGFMELYRYIALQYSRVSQGASVLSIDYRVAPQYHYPAALEDALKAWNWLLQNGYKEENIIVVGDSAGGNLVLALTAKLRDTGRKLPKAIYCMSPWADMACEGDSYKYNMYNDPNFGSHKREDASGSTNLDSSYAGTTDLHDKYLSPVYGDFSGFPDMLLHIGTHEILESDALTIYEKATAAGVNITFTRYEEMFHVFQLLCNLLPEGKRAWREIGSFLTAHFYD